MKFRGVVTASVVTLTLAHAAPPDKPLQPAGPAPSNASVRAALLDHLAGRNSAFDKRKPFRILSGPTLATGNTFAGNIEQAWLVCVAVDAVKKSPGPVSIEGKSLYLRRDPVGRVTVVPVENWQDSSPKCGGEK